MTEHASAEIASLVLEWFDRCGRHDLPWQRERSPYRVWVSEIMLQQTQVSVVISYFERFMAVYPTVLDLAAAELDGVLALWSGLGYYARARNLHRAARLIRDQHGGLFPDTQEALLRLPGIGRSTAGAILSLALDRSYPILDGNVRRLFARLFAVNGWPGNGPALARLWGLAERCLSRDRPGDYNQGLMDLGALICTRGRPQCPICPLAGRCLARAQGRQSQLPAPRPARALPTRSTLLLIIRHPQGAILLERRPPAGIWGGLWSLPELEPTEGIADWCRSALGVAPQGLVKLAERHHAFTHYRLRMQPVLVELGAEPTQIQDRPDWRWFIPSSEAVLGLPAPIARLLAELAESDESIGQTSLRLNDS
ncbi:A/G-specific adenine glycosylase [Caldichromatium japonicum]|uniref:Adenine DNA glycosylase n=1 Tax=Caldichromatium japonicum TaxID=2699430 RepID=A0A6G7VDV4_9GAMM|nr:A/G-specific adenine glycosylase [Caldichromatium japonicum]QIK38253.1 A/G-specific adenine glycosylase [Caldichromatium japonicum]